MFKNTLLFALILAYLLMYTSQAKKSTIVKGAIFSDENKMKQFKAEDSGSNTVEKVQKIIRRYMDSPVVFADCPGPHEDIYDIDDDYSYTDPSLAKKNIDISLILEGVMNQDEHVDQLHLDVYWNGNLFHSEDHTLDDDVEEQEPYELKFTWFVPGFAPSGAYIVDLVVKSAGQELGCERATFTL